MPESAGPPDLVGRTLVKDLRVLALLTETPEGYLYSARSPSGHEVALLVSPPDAGGEGSDGVDPFKRARRRVREERVHQLIQIRHPNIMEVYEAGETPDGLYCIVLEPLVGQLLSTPPAARGSFPMQDAVEIGLQASAGLVAAHARGLVHGNLSPQSMVITRTADDRLRLKLMGFSLGVFLRGEGPEQRAAATYASTEQACGVAADERSDVFSLAAILHHLLSGFPPESEAVADSIPRKMRRVLAKALADAPARRFQSMEQFSDALERAADAVRRPRPRSPRRILVGGAAAAALIGAVGVALFLSPHLRRDSTASLAAKIDFHGVEVGVSSAVIPEPEPDTAPVQSMISPYRRSHPWAARPGGRYYYRSSCPEALRLTELLFFASEREARDSGFVPTDIPGCY